MGTSTRSLSLVGVLLGLAAAPAAAGDEATTYVLRDFSHHEEGCYAPCLCPIRALFLGGTFDLRHTGADGGFETFDVENVQWIATVGGPLTRVVTGGGRFRIDDEQQRLELDLQFDGGEVVHLDSGLVPSGANFPRIDVLASVGDLFCYDEVVVVRAEPRAPNYVDLSVGTTSLYWSISSTSDDYDVVAGDLSLLRGSGGNFTGATADCVVEALDQPVVALATSLEPGQGIWFAVRGLPGAPYDSNAASQTQTRDAEIEASPASCP